MSYTDAVLKSYLAGSATAQEIDEIEAAVQRDPALELRLMALDPFAAPVRRAFPTLPGQERLGYVDYRVDAGPVCVGQPARTRLPLVAPLLVGVLVGGGLYGWLDKGTAAPPDWETQVAAYHMLYVPETVAAITPEPSQLERQFAKAAAAIDLDLEQEAMAELAPLRLKRAQILGFQDAPLIQIAFSLPDGTPIAFCIYRPADGASASALRMSEISGLRTASWATDNHAFLLIGGTDPHPIEEVGKRLFTLFAV